MECINKKVPLLVAFNIVSMGTIATFLALVFNWGGVCIDVLNVASPAAIWGEWMACGPLLLFITVTVVDKPHLSWGDWFFMITFFLCLLTGFFIIIPSTYAGGAFWLTISCVTYIPVLYLPWYNDGFKRSVDELNDVRKMNVLAESYAQRYNLAMWLTFILPLYTVNYLIATWNGINAAQTIVIYQILSVLTKGLFAAYCMDIHIDLLMDTERALVEERRANEARRVFMKYIFHEVRTPLNSLTVGIDLLMMSPHLDGPDTESLLMMKSATDFMSDTLDDVLSMQKIEEGKLELEFSPFGLQDSIRKIFAAFRGAVTKKDITLVSIISPSVPAKIIGDVHKIEHVISNLLSNAIKFSPKNKSIKVEVICDSIVTCDSSIDNSDGRIANLSIVVEDQGLGISEENQALLFNNFVQIRPGSLQEGQGSGLGLSFCKQIVLLHKGTIGITSIEGQGSKFKFTIPFPIAAQTEAACIAIDVKPENNFNTEFQNKQSPSISLIESPTVPSASTELKEGVELINPLIINSLSEVSEQARINTKIVEDLATTNWKDDFEVLVVDDADSNRKILMSLLKRKGLKVVSAAENGEIAVNIVREDINKYKLIFMDNLMPVMNGVDATKALRQMGYPYLIVGVTGNVMEDDIAEYHSGGADLVISKPMKISVLDQLLKSIELNGSASKATDGLKLVEKGDSMEWENVSILASK